MASRRKHRREKGTGSIYQLGNGRWQAALEIGGRTVRRTTVDRASAEAALQDLLDIRQRGVDLGATSQPLRTWLDTWLRQMQRSLSERAYTDYRHQIETYILPTLGEMPLNQIQSHHLQALINGIVDDIAAHTTHAGTRTAHLVATRLDAALELATLRNLIRTNPMRGVILPKDRPALIEPPTERQIAAFLSVARTHPQAPLWYAIALLGLRRGEGLGLTWSNVDLEQGTIRITQQVQALGTPQRLVISQPKSRAGIRMLPAPAVLLDLLRQHRIAQLEVRLRRADTWTDSDLVCCNRDGGALWPRSVSDAYYVLRTQAGLPPTIKLHHFRHALSTLLDENGATDALKAGILGHGTKNVTQRYTHARLAAMRQVLERVTEKVMRDVA